MVTSIFNGVFMYTAVVFSTKDLAETYCQEIAGRPDISVVGALEEKVDASGAIVYMVRIRSWSLD